MSNDNVGCIMEWFPSINGTQHWGHTTLNIGVRSWKVSFVWSA